MIVLVILPFFYSPAVTDTINNTTVKRSPVTSVSRFQQDHIIDIVGHPNGYVLLSSNTTSDSNGYFVIFYSLNHQVKWVQNITLEGSTEVPKLIAGEDYILVRNIKSSHKSTAGNFLYNNTIRYWVTDINGTSMQQIVHTDIKLKYTNYQLSLGRGAFFEHILGDDLFLVDYLVSDRTNIDGIQVNITKYDLSQMQRKWSEVVYSSSIDLGNIRTVPGSFHHTNATISLAFHFNSFRSSGIVHEIRKFTLDRQKGTILQTEISSIICKQCDYKFYELDRRMIYTNKTKQQNSTSLAFSLLDMGTGGSITLSHEFDVASYTPINPNLAIFGINNQQKDHSEAFLATVNLIDNHVQVDQFRLHNDTWAASRILKTISLGSITGIFFEYFFQVILFPDTPTIVSDYALVLESVTEKVFNELLSRTERPLYFYPMYGAVFLTVIYFLLVQFRKSEGNIKDKDILYPQNHLQ